MPNQAAAGGGQKQAAPERPVGRATVPASRSACTDRCQLLYWCRWMFAFTSIPRRGNRTSGITMSRRKRWRRSWRIQAKIVLGERAPAWGLAKRQVGDT